MCEIFILYVFISCSTQRSLSSLYRLMDRDHTCVASTSGITSCQPPVLYSECRCFLSMATTSLSWADYLTSCLTPKEARKEFASAQRKHFDFSLFFHCLFCRAPGEGLARSFLTTFTVNYIILYII